MTRGRRRLLCDQSLIIWTGVDQESTFDAVSYIDSGRLGAEVQVMPYNPKILEAVAGLPVK